MTAIRNSRLVLVRAVESGRFAIKNDCTCERFGSKLQHLRHGNIFRCIYARRSTIDKLETEGVTLVRQSGTLCPGFALAVRHWIWFRFSLRFCLCIWRVISGPAINHCQVSFAHEAAAAAAQHPLSFILDPSREGNFCTSPSMRYM